MTRLGQIFKVLCNTFSYTSGQNVSWLLRPFKNISFYRKNYCVHHFLGNFWDNWVAFKFKHLVTLIATFSRSAAGRSSTVRWSARRSGSSTTARSGSFLAGFTPMTSIRSTSRVSCKLRFPFLSPIKRFFNGPFRTSSSLVLSLLF